MTFQKANKKQRRLRLAIFGASGSGKTMSALRIAKGFGGSVALIDTENSAELYADRFDFDIAHLEHSTIENMIAFIEEAKDYKVLVIDSLSHSWKELLDDVSRIAKAKFQGNTYAAWSEGTPKQNKLIKALLGFEGHLICTMRSATEWTVNKNEKGKAVPQRVGLKPVQGKDIEFEFDMLMEITPDHFASVIKDRTGKFQDKTIEKPDEKFGKDLIDWLDTGEAVETPEDRINNCNSLDELRGVWALMTKAEQTKHEVIKEEKKQELTTETT